MEFAIAAAVALTLGFLLGVVTEAIHSRNRPETGSLWQNEALSAAFDRGFDARKREVAAMAAAAKVRRRAAPSTTSGESRSRGVRDE